MNRETGKSFNKAKAKDGEKVKKSSAFPTCVSLNKCVGAPWPCVPCPQHSLTVSLTVSQLRVPLVQQRGGRDDGERGRLGEN